MRSNVAFGFQSLLTAGSLGLLTCVVSAAPTPLASPREVAEARPMAVSAPAPPRPTPAPSAPAVAALPSDASFAAWLDHFRAQALAVGIQPETLDRELAGLVPDPRVVTLDDAQPDRAAVSPMRYAEYRTVQLSEHRVRRGQRLRSDLSATLSSVEAQFGVPAEILLAIWGKETSYGEAPGRLDVIRSLATLAHDGRRRDFFTAELIAALQLIESGAAVRGTLVGSWAGATGQTQFMPSSYLAHAADGDGDGRADIWTSRADALASIAAYFVGHGWRTGEPWALAVEVPAALDRERVRNLTPVAECAGLNWKHSRWLSVAEWRALGVRADEGLLPDDHLLATLIEPDGPEGAAYLTFANYRPIMRYNCTNYYALAVGELADTIGEAGLSRARLVSAGAPRAVSPTALARVR